MDYANSAYLLAGSGPRAPSSIRWPLVPVQTILGDLRSTLTTVGPMQTLTIRLESGDEITLIAQCIDVTGS
jgi:hypothetical protein